MNEKLEFTFKGSKADFDLIRLGLETFADSAVRPDSDTDEVFMFNEFVRVCARKLLRELPDTSASYGKSLCGKFRAIRAMTYKYDYDPDYDGSEFKDEVKVEIVGE